MAMGCLSVTLKSSRHYQPARHAGLRPRYNLFFNNNWHSFCFDRLRHCSSQRLVGKQKVPIDLSFSAMAARVDQAPARWRRPFLTWLDGIETGWAVPLLLVAFVLIWMAFLTVAYSGGGLHPDTLETWTLGRKFEWGNPKHPPLMGWVACAWTSVFPLTDWSFRLLAMINSAIALWAVELISRRFVRGDKRVVVLLLLMLLPTYQFHAQRFNANAVLLALWPFATYCFLRSFETREITWAAATGAMAAFAMLGKYYSVFLIGSFVLAAVCHPQRRAYFGSPAPWVSAAVGLGVLGPHLYWLARTGAMPFQYAMAAQMGVAFIPSLTGAIFFLLGIGASMAIAALAWILIAGYRLKQFPEDFRAMSPGLLLLFLVSIGTIVFPIITAVLFGTYLPSLWATQGLFLFAILIVCGAGYPIQRFYSVNLAVFVIGIALVAAIVAAPIHAVYRNIYSYEEVRNLYRPLALELTRQWHEQSDTPMPAVSGDDALAFATAFYSPDHPVYARPFVHQYTWPLPRETTLERGWVGLCSQGQGVCLDWMEKTAARALRVVHSEIVVQSSLLGWPGIKKRFHALIIISPRNQETVTPSAESSVPTANFRAD
jgi:4-amino-4-deoxy-L-arabinose transferase-like glycosyltransferase